MYNFSLMTEKASMMKNWQKISWKQMKWISGTAHFWPILSSKEKSKFIFSVFDVPENNSEVVHVEEYLTGRLVEMLTNGTFSIPPQAKRFFFEISAKIG